MEKHGFERPKYFVPPNKGRNVSVCLSSFLRISHFSLELTLYFRSDLNPDQPSYFGISIAGIIGRNHPWLCVCCMHVYMCTLV